VVAAAAAAASAAPSEEDRREAQRISAQLTELIDRRAAPADVEAALRRHQDSEASRLRLRLAINLAANGVVTPLANACCSYEYDSDDMVAVAKLLVAAGGDANDAGGGRASPMVYALEAGPRTLAVLLDSTRDLAGLVQRLYSFAPSRQVQRLLRDRGLLPLPPPPRPDDDPHGGDPVFESEAAAARYAEMFAPRARESE
jgi:hypothetical protein